MKILLAEHQGFCYGVRRAVEMAHACAQDRKPAYTLGPIIHNPQVVASLAQEGVGLANHLDEIQDGTVIIRSHGVGPAIYGKAEEKGLTVVDATCPHVKKAQQAAADLAKDRYKVVIIGEKNHPEVKSILEWAGSNAVVIESIAEAEVLPDFKHMGVVVQTTFSAQLFEKIVAVLREKCQDVKIDRTICMATDLRQKAARELACKVDIMIVVGGKNSANTARLVQVCQEAGCQVHHVETEQELEKDWFTGVDTAGITAGASTPDWLIEEVYKKMQEFGEMLKDDFNKLETGSIIKGKVVGVRKDEVFVDIGYKAEGIIPSTELAYPAPEQASDIIAVGDIIDLLVIDADPSEGGIKLSKVQADKILAWDKLEAAFQNKQAVEAKVTENIKGGLAVSVFGMRGFVPASHVELSFVEDLSSYVGKELMLVPIEIDKQKQRLVLSRKVILAEERSKREAELFSQLAPEQVIRGKVTRLVSFGAFVDVGGVEGLIHISDLSWQRVKTPDEVVKVGDEVEVFVLKVDPAAKRISLSLKQLQRDPWLDAIDKFSENMTVKGKVTKLAKFGAFVEIEPGIEGLVPMSELADRRVSTASEVVEQGQLVNVKILSIDKKAKRIGLSIVKAQQEAERAQFQGYLDQQENKGLTVTLGDQFAHLFKR